MKKVLTIAGSDSCGGAGIQADLKTVSALGLYGMTVITAITAQNTKGVKNVCELNTQIIKEQIDAIFEDIEVDAVKIGMVSSPQIIETIGEALQRHSAKNIVVDPVMVSKNGCHLLQPEAGEALINVLLPLADVATPNLFETEVITGKKVNTVTEMEKAAVAIKQMGAKYVVIKGGHLEGDAVDVLYDGVSFDHIKSSRISTPHTHGTGCTFSSAIAAYLAKGFTVQESVRKAKEYITEAIKHSFALGQGVGPTHHFYNYFREE